MELGHIAPSSDSARNGPIDFLVGCDNADVLRFCCVCRTIVGPLAVQIPHSSKWRNNLQFRPITPLVLQEGDRDDGHLPIYVLYTPPIHLLLDGIHRDDNLRSSRRTMATRLPGIVVGDLSIKLLGRALAPTVQAIVHRLWSETGRTVFWTSGRRARCALHFRDRA